MNVCASVCLLQVYISFVKSITIEERLTIIEKRIGTEISELRAETKRLRYENEVLNQKLINLKEELNFVKNDTLSNGKHIFRASSESVNLRENKNKITENLSVPRTNFSGINVQKPLTKRESRLGTVSKSKSSFGILSFLFLF